MNIIGKRSNNGMAFDVLLSDDELIKINEGCEGVREMLTIMLMTAREINSRLKEGEKMTVTKMCKCGNDSFSLHTDENYIKIVYNSETKNWDVERAKDPKVSAFMICKKCGQSIHYTEDPAIHAALEFYLA